MPEVTKNLQLVARNGVLEGRSRLGRMQMLNANTFPLTVVPGASEPDSSPTDLPVRDDVTVRLAQGIGIAVAPSTWMSAYTVWWVVDAETAQTHPGVATFASASGTYSTPVSVMKSFVSATSREYANAQILVAALPYRVARGWASQRTLDLSFTCGRISLTAMSDDAA